MGLRANATIIGDPEYIEDIVKRTYTQLGKSILINQRECRRRKDDTKEENIWKADRRTGYS